MTTWSVHTDKVENVSVGKVFVLFGTLFFVCIFMGRYFIINATEAIHGQTVASNIALHCLYVGHGLKITVGDTIRNLSISSQFL